MSESKKQEVELTVAELGFPEGVTSEQILSALQERGLRLLTEDEVKELVRQYPDEFEQEGERVPMEPEDFQQAGAATHLEWDGERWLLTKKPKKWERDFRHHFLAVRK